MRDFSTNSWESLRSIIKTLLQTLLFYFVGDRNEWKSHDLMSLFHSFISPGWSLLLFWKLNLSDFRLWSKIGDRSSIIQLKVSLSCRYYTRCSVVLKLSGWVRHILVFNMLWVNACKTWLLVRARYRWTVVSSSCLEWGICGFLWTSFTQVTVNLPDHASG